MIVLEIDRVDESGNTIEQVYEEGVKHIGISILRENDSWG